jgi:hypothetical protein
MGGLLAGILQQHLLRPHSSRAVWWMPASVIGWALPGGAIAVNDLGLVTGPWGELLSIGAMFFGGAILGAVTGMPLLWVRQSPAV